MKLNNDCHDKSRDYRKGYIAHMKYNAIPKAERPPKMDSNDLEATYGVKYRLGWEEAGEAVYPAQKPVSKRKGRKG